MERGPTSSPIEPKGLNVERVRLESLIATKYMQYALTIDRDCKKEDNVRHSKGSATVHGQGDELHLSSCSMTGQ